MIGVILRFIPYLYLFIKEMYRKDKEKGVTQKQRSYYRSGIALLLSAFMGYGIVSGWMLHNKIHQVSTLEKQLIDIRGEYYVNMTHFVTRSEHDVLLQRLRQSQSLNTQAHDALVQICQLSSYDCQESTQHTVSALSRFLGPAVLDTPKKTP